MGRVWCSDVPVPARTDTVRACGSLLAVIDVCAVSVFALRQKKLVHVARIEPDPALNIHHISLNEMSPYVLELIVTDESGQLTSFRLRRRAVENAPLIVEQVNEWILDFENQQGCEDPPILDLASNGKITMVCFRKSFSWLIMGSNRTSLPVHGRLCAIRGEAGRAVITQDDLLLLYTDSKQQWLTLTHTPDATSLAFVSNNAVIVGYQSGRFQVVRFDQELPDLTTFMPIGHAGAVVRCLGPISLPLLRSDEPLSSRVPQLQLMNHAADEFCGNQAMLVCSDRSIFVWPFVQANGDLVELPSMEQWLNWDLVFPLSSKLADCNIIVDECKPSSVTIPDLIIAHSDESMFVRSFHLNDGVRSIDHISLTDEEEQIEGNPRHSTGGDDDCIAPCLIQPPHEGMASNSITNSSLKWRALPLPEPPVEHPSRVSCNTETPIQESISAIHHRVLCAESDLIDLQRSFVEFARVFTADMADMIRIVRNMSQTGSKLDFCERTSQAS